MKLLKRHIVFFIAVVLGVISPSQRAFAQMSQVISQVASQQQSIADEEFHYLVKHAFSIATPVSHFLHKFIEEVETPEEELHRKKATSSKSYHFNSNFPSFSFTLLHTPELTKRSSTYGRFFYIFFERFMRFRVLLI